MTTASEVQSAAELERQRLAQQAAQARAQAGAQAQQAEEEIEAQARGAISETERQAQTARSEVGREAESRQADIRKQRGQAEREAETAKAKARQAQRLEQRKVVLPVSKPRDLGLASYVANVETARKQAHQAGESAKIAVTKVRDDYFQQVDKAKDAAIANINKQKAGVITDIQAQLVNINADLTKQLANLNSGVDGWEADSKAKIAKAQADYETAIQATLNRSGDEVFADMQNKGLIPADAVYDSYNKTTGQLNYTTPDTRSGQQIFADLQSQNKIPPNAQYKGYDTGTGEVSYSIETPQFGSGIFKTMQNKGQIPKDATFIGYNATGKAVTYFVAGAGITTIPETTGASPTPDNSVTTSTSTSTAGSSQNSANVVAAAGSILTASAGAITMEQVGIGIASFPSPPTWIIGGTLIAAAIIIGVIERKKIANSINNLLGKNKEQVSSSQAADAIVTDNSGSAAYTIQQITFLPGTKGSNIETFPYLPPQDTTEKMIPPKIEPWKEGFTLTNEKPYIETFPDLKEPPLVIIRDPFDVPELRGKASNVLAAALAVAQAQRVITKTLPMPKEQWDQVEEALRRGRVVEGKRILNDIAAKGVPDISQSHNTAFEEYLRKKAILDAARKSYVASLNPQPIKGKGSTDATAAATGLWLAQDIIQGKVAKALSEGKPLNQAMAEAQTDIKTASKQLGLTQQQINAAMATMVYQVALSEMTQAAVQAASQAQAQNLTATQTQTQTLQATKAAAQTAVHSAVQTQTLTAAQAAELAQELDQVAEAVATTTAKIKLPKLPKGASNTEEKEYPDGTIVWKMGETKRGEEYKIIPPPYTMLKPISSKTPPKGMVRTKGTPQETLTFIGGKVPFANVSFDLGVTDGFIDVKAKKIEFTGGGQQTNVGTRIESTTKGVALTNNKALMGRPRIERVSARPRRGRLVSHGVYADKSSRRITRKRRRGWRRIY